MKRNEYNGDLIIKRTASNHISTKLGI